MKDKMDVVFSVGLIEHFSPEGTRKVIKAHFDAVRSGGIVLMSFPTPTWLYHCTRFFSELFGLWIFTDERPLHKEEVLDAVALYGHILYVKTIWPIFLTQKIVIAKKY
jgi:cyclopropane fatty-acyl-phospholipid synthase-like methyltransferase